MNKQFSIEDYRNFSYQAPEIKPCAGSGSILSFTYTLAGQAGSKPIEFTEELEFPDLDLSQLAENAAFRPAADLLALVLGVSYYKTTLPDNLDTSALRLDAGMCSYLDQLYFNGLQEFAYLNQLRLEPETGFNPNSAELTAGIPIVGLDAKKILLPAGGGKDSLLCLEYLQQYYPDYQIILFTLGDNPVVTKLAKARGLELISVARRIDPQLFALNKAGALNGHVPFSAILAHVSVIVALATGAQYILLANESSADEANVIVDGVSVNHQYSKTYEFECSASEIIRTKVHPELQYFSLLRPFTEVLIAKELTRFTASLSIFSSCNQTKKLAAAGSDVCTQRWCTKCAKCCFVWVLFAPFVPLNDLEKIFSSNLFADADNDRHFDELAGLSGQKPFECVGEQQEVQSCLNALRSNPEYMGSGYLLRIANKALPAAQELKTFYPLRRDQQIPKAFSAILEQFVE